MPSHNFLTIQFGGYYCFSLTDDPQRALDDIRAAVGAGAHLVGHLTFQSADDARPIVDRMTQKHTAAFSHTVAGVRVYRGQAVAADAESRRRQFATARRLVY